MVKLFLSTPCYGGLCLEAYASSIIGLQMEMIKEGIQLYLDTTENESLVHRARNVSVGRFMQKSDADYFMFIDADVHFDPKSVTRLLKSGHDVAVACYPKKYIDWDAATKAVNSGDERNMAMLSASLVVNFGAQHIKVEDGFIPILDGPTGFMLIKREVFEKMAAHYPELTCKNDHQNRDFDEYCALFDCMIDPVSRRYLSEDYAFCRRWQQMNGKIYADINTTLGHVGNLPFSGCLEDRLKAKNLSKVNAACSSGSDSEQVGVGQDPPHDPEIQREVSDEAASG
jgi:hypothetical protein